MNVEDYLQDLSNGFYAGYKEEVIDGVLHRFETEEIYNDFYANNVYKWTKLFPRKILDLLDLYNFAIVVTEEIYRGGEREADGCCMFNPNLDQNIFNTIIVETNDNKSLILHEVGHFIDFCFGEIKCKYSGNIELKKIILKEFKEFNDVFINFFYCFGTNRDDCEDRRLDVAIHALNYYEPLEYFAETFAMFLMVPSFLEAHCPLTYEYVKKVYVDELGGKVLWEN